MKKVITTLLVSILFLECSTVPITGRKRINFVSDSKILPQSFAQYRGFLSKNKKSKDEKSTLLVKKVGKRISQAVDRFMRAHGMNKEADAYRWEFNLVESKDVNAWCLPGGKVVFYTGIMPICKNENGVAVVMGHEVAHAFAKHGQERMSSAQIQQGLAMGVALGAKNSKNAKLWNMAYGIGSQVGMLAFSRAHETEADKLGLVFMIMAGYDGNEAPKLWVRMSKNSNGKKPPEFLSTHPSDKRRVETLQNYLPEARRLAKKYNSQMTN